MVRTDDEALMSVSILSVSERFKKYYVIGGNFHS